jgi:hypothetical protein
MVCPREESAAASDCSTVIIARVVLVLAVYGNHSSLLCGERRDRSAAKAERVPALL